MSNKNVKCDNCGETYTIGDWPYCPHGSDGRGSFAPFTPYVDPNLLPHGDPRNNAKAFIPGFNREVPGVLITSREQRKKLMKETNTDWAGRSYGDGGTEF